MTAEQFELVQATSRELIDFTRQENSASWSGVLTRPQYVVREAVLGKSRMMKHDSHDNTLVVLVLQRIEDKVPVSSIEVMVRESVRVDYTGGKTLSKKILSGCIGGVFTYPDHRGKGYGKIMLDKCVNYCKSNLVGEDGFTFLYSEIGEYYVRNGFTSYPVDLINIPVVKTQPIEEEVLVLKYHDFEDILKVYKNQLTKDVLHQVETDHKTRVFLTPTSHIVDWFHLRSKFISYMLTHEEQKRVDFTDLSYDQIAAIFKKTRPNNYGLALNDSKGGLIAAVVFTLDWSSKSENYATILKIVVDDKYSKDKYTQKIIQALLNYLSENPELADQTCLKVILWESEISGEVKNFLIEKFNSKHGLENGSRSAVLLNNDQDQSKLVSGDLIWAGNDKIPWF